jgi:hypothetical protein
MPKTTNSGTDNAATVAAADPAYTQTVPSTAHPVQGFTVLLPPK